MIECSLGQTTAPNRSLADSPNDLPYFAGRICPPLVVSRLGALPTLPSCRETPCIGVITDQAGLRSALSLL
jgi:hypothetical protein